MDDYPPIFTPMYANHHGVYGHTLETPDNSLDGVRWMVDAVMGSLKFSSENKLEMTKDQLEIFKRGVGFEHVDHPDGYFPNAYLLPLDEQNASATIKGVNELLRHGLIVEKTTETFETNDQSYEEGTYVVRLDQAKRSLANVLLWDGEDISDQASAMYDVSAWNIPELWGFEATPLYEDVSVALEPVTEPLESVGQLIGDGPYVLLNNSVESVQLVNELINEGVEVIRSEEGHFHIDATRNEQLESVISDSNLYLETTDIPRDGSMIHSPEVAILNDRSNHGTRAALLKMGYQVTGISTNDVINHKLEDFDLVIANGGQFDESEDYKKRVHEFIDAGGHYFAIGQSASSVAVNQLELSDATTHTGPRNSNGVVHVDYTPSSVTHGYDEEDLGFVYNTIWFSDVTDEEVVARFAEEDFFKAGFWKDAKEASGQPIVIEGKKPNVTIMGLEPGFRDHPEYLYRLLSNVIFTSSQVELVTPERALMTIENLVDAEQIYYASTINRLTAAAERVIEEDNYDAARNYWNIVIWQWNLNSFSREAYTELRYDAEELLAYYE
ncbi:hypothetical protein [Geomicrobium sp. JCM 19038]|uniref:hypothetical protein n=1 Tax=Geomicrobium sp. JCM 19038 TaxID=1460635 RepID=UPI001268039D|nr:hypothetical protein [Geomicrobium sp. JCM 19038]